MPTTTSPTCSCGALATHELITPAGRAGAYLHEGYSVELRPVCARHMAALRTVADAFGPALERTRPRSEQFVSRTPAQQAVIESAVRACAEVV